MIVKHGNSGIEIEIAFKGKAHSLMGDLRIKEIDIKEIFMIFNPEQLIKKVNLSKLKL